MYFGKQRELHMFKGSILNRNKPTGPGVKDELRASLINYEKIK